MRKQRRDFLKLATVGSAGLVLLRGKHATAGWPASGNIAINPKISNMRVVACNDSAMMKSAPTSMAFATENAAVDAARVQANMDAMAMQLAEAPSADDAWKAIFRSSKPWASTIVAIKVNTIEPKNMARVAVIEKFCRVMVGFGVPAANIFIYDGNSTYGAGISNYTSYFSATDSSKIPGVVCSYNDQLGGTTNVTLPDGSSTKCTADIASGKVDILINIANNKGHSLHGGSTLCLKNHFGTFAPNHTDLASYVLAINKTDAIVGGDPARQQLCFVDSLIANKASNTGTPEAMPCYLVMGTFAPAVDYLTVKKIREPVMNATHDAATVNAWLTSFGYTTSDPVWVPVSPASASGGDAGAGGASGTGGNTGAGRGGNSGPPDAGRGGTAGGGDTASPTATGGSTRPAGGAGGAGTGASSSASGAGGTAGTGGFGGPQVPSQGGAGGSVAGGSKGSGGSGGAGAGGTGEPSADGTGGQSTVPAPGGTAGTNHSPSSGCGCDVGGIRPGVASIGALLVVGAAVAGPLRRLLARRERLADARPDASLEKETEHR
jgi:hypothetical protein